MKHSTYLRHIYIVVLCIALTACAGEKDLGSLNRTPDSNQSSLKMSTVPSNSEADVPFDISTISVYFNLVIDQNTLTETNVTITPALDYNFNSAVTGNKITAQISINSQLQPDTTYILSLNNLKYRDGSPIPTKSFSFTTSLQNNTGNSSITDTTQPTTPGNLRQNETAYNYVSLSWDSATDDSGIKSYRLYRDDNFIANLTTTSYTDINVQENTSYRYTVASVDTSNNESVKSATLTINIPLQPVTGDITPPSTPANLRESGLAFNFISLNWDSATDDTAIKGYRIYRNNTFLADVTSNSYIDLDVQEAKSYEYSVSAIDTADNESAKTTILNISTPKAPSNTVSAPETTGATSINMFLRSDYALEQQPIKSGIPFPMGTLTSADNVRLESADGSQEYQAQVESLANWPDGSIKAALVQFIDNLPKGERKYRISYGSNVIRHDFGKSIQVSQGDKELTVDTGKIKFTLNNATGAIDALWRDANNDQVYQDSEQTLQGSELYMVNAFNQQEYTSRPDASTQLTVEEQGPVRTVIKVTGALRNSSSETLMKYKLRYYAYLDSDQIDMDYTVIDDRLEENVQKTGPNLAISVSSYGLRLDYTGSNPQYRFGGSNQQVHEGPVTGEHYLFQNGEFVYDNGKDLGHRFNYSGAGTGDRAAGWMAVDTDQHHIVARVRDFWQQYPNELSVNNSTLTIALHPERASGSNPETKPPTQSGTRYKRAKTFYFLREGGAKNYQLQFSFPVEQTSNSLLQAYNDQYNTHKLNFMASPQWYTSSKVFGDLNVGTDPNADVGYESFLFRDIYKRSSRKGPEGEGQNMDVYGWRDYGDRLRAGWETTSNGVRIPSFYNDTHVGANNYFKEFLRTGEQTWFGFAEISTRHFMDIDVSHGPRKGKWKTPTQSDIQPAGEVHVPKHSVIDHEARSLHQGHSHVSGLSDFYLLTGDKRSKEVLWKITNWWGFMAKYRFRVPFDFDSDYREAERDIAWPLYVLTEHTRIFGDPVFHKEIVANVIKYLIQWWQTPRDHIGYDPVTDSFKNVGVNDASKGTGYWTMTKMDNGTSINGVAANGTNPWMAGPLISNIIIFYEQDLLFRANGEGSDVDHALLKDMLYQTMNYIIKYGYKADVGKFVYSEVRRKSSNNFGHLVYGLAYLDRLYKTELAAGKISNPQWYDTQGMWRDIALNAYNDYTSRKTGENLQGYGFYGYEVVYPLDFFKVIADSIK